MKFKLDSIHIMRTYGGCYTGRPSVSQSIESAKKYAEMYFGSPRPTLVLQKITTDPAQPSDAHPRNREKLPEWQFVAWLDGPAKDENFCGSQLIVIWWADNSAFALPPEVQAIDWDKHAEDYDI